MNTFHSSDTKKDIAFTGFDKNNPFMSINNKECLIDIFPYISIILLHTLISEVINDNTNTDVAKIEVQKVINNVNNIILSNEFYLKYIQLLKEYKIYQDNGLFLCNGSTIEYIYKDVNDFIENTFVGEVVKEIMSFSKKEPLKEKIILSKLTDYSSDDYIKYITNVFEKLTERKAFTLMLKLTFKEHYERMTSRSKEIHGAEKSLSQLTSFEVSSIDLPLLVNQCNDIFNQGGEEGLKKISEGRLLIDTLESYSDFSTGYLYMFNNNKLVKEISDEFILYINSKNKSLVFSERILDIDDELFDVKNISPETTIFFKNLLNDNPENFIKKLENLPYQNFSNILKAIFNPNFSSDLNIKPIIEKFFSEPELIDLSLFNYLSIFISSCSELLIDKICNITDDSIFSGLVEGIQISSWFDMYDDDKLLLKEITPLLKEIRNRKLFGIVNLNNIYNKLGAKYFVSEIEELGGKELEGKELVELFKNIFTNINNIKNIISGLNKDNALYLRIIKLMNNNISSFKSINKDSLKHFLLINPLIFLNNINDEDLNSLFGIELILSYIEKIPTETNNEYLKNCESLDYIPKIMVIYYFNKGLLGVTNFISNQANNGNNRALENNSSSNKEELIIFPSEQLPKFTSIIGKSPDLDKIEFDSYTCKRILSGVSDLNELDKNILNKIISGNPEEIYEYYLKNKEKEVDKTIAKKIYDLISNPESAFAIDTSLIIEWCVRHNPYIECDILLGSDKLAILFGLKYKDQKNDNEQSILDMSYWLSDPDFISVLETLDKLLFSYNKNKYITRICSLKGNLKNEWKKNYCSDKISDLLPLLGGNPNLLELLFSDVKTNNDTRNFLSINPTHLYSLLSIINQNGYKINGDIKEGLESISTQKKSSN